MKPDPFARTVTFRDLESVASAAAKAAQADGRNDAFSTLDDLLSAVRDAASGTCASLAAAADSELVGLFREWLALKHNLDNTDLEMESLLWQRGQKRLLDLETKMAAVRPGTMHGLAVKILVAADGRGEDDHRRLVSDAHVILADLPT